MDAGAVEADPALADQAACIGVGVGQAGLDEQPREADPSPAQAIAAERDVGDLIGELAGPEDAVELRFGGACRRPAVVPRGDLPGQPPLGVAGMRPARAE